MNNSFGDYTTSGQVEALTPSSVREQFSMSPFGGRGTGMAAVDQLMMMTLGSRMHPLPQRGTRTGIHDAYLQRERDMERVSIQRHALANGLAFKKMGGVDSTSPLFQIMGAMMSHPDGMVSRTLSPLVGGNPILSQMSAYKELGGVNMSGFGSIRDTHGAELSGFQDTLYNKFYNWRSVDKDTLRGSQASIMQAARRGGIDAGTMARASKMFSSKDFTLDTNKAGTGKYDEFKTEVNTLRKVAGALDNNDLSTAEGKKKAKDAADAFISAITDANAKKKYSDAYASAIKDGSADGFKKAVGYESIDKMARQLEAHQQLKTGEKIPVSINFKDTFGFKIEDITSAFTESAKHRMLGNKGFGASSEAFFSSGNMGMLDAARSLFGNDKTGKEIMAAGNDFLGVSSVDLTNATQGSRLEKLMRDVHALGRTANISIEHLLDIINTGKEVASRTRGLGGLGGLEIGEMLVKASPEILAGMATTSSSSIRAAGGTAGFFNRSLMGKLKQASEPMALSLAGLHTYFKGDSKAQAEVREFAQTANLSDWSAHSNLLKHLATTYHKNHQDMYAYAESNTTAQAMGMRESDVFQNSGARAAAHTALRQTHANVGGHEAGRMALRQLSNAVSRTTVDLKGYIDELGITEKDAPRGAQSMALAKAIMAEYEANSTEKGADGTFLTNRKALSNLGVTTYEDLLSATPEVRQKYGGLYDKIYKLRGNLTDRVSTQFDEAGRVIQVGGKDSFGAIGKHLLTKKEIDEQELEALAGNIGGPQFATIRDLTQNKSYNVLSDYDPTFKEAKTLMAERIKEDSALDAVTARKFGFLNSPMLTQVFNQVLGGDVDSKDEVGIKKMLVPLGLSENSKEYSNVRRSTLGIIGIRNALSFDDLGNTLRDQGVYTAGNQDIRKSATFGELAKTVRAHGYSTAGQFIDDGFQGKLAKAGKLGEKYGLHGADFEKIANASDAERGKLIQSIVGKEQWEKMNGEDIAELSATAKTGQEYGLGDFNNGPVTLAKLNEKFKSKNSRDYTTADLTQALGALTTWSNGNIKLNGDQMYSIGQGSDRKAQIKKAKQVLGDAGYAKLVANGDLEGLLTAAGAAYMLDFKGLGPMTLESMREHFANKATDVADAGLGKRFKNIADVSQKNGLKASDLASIDKESTKERKIQKLKELLGDSKFSKLSESDIANVLSASHDVTGLKLGNMGEVDIKSLHEKFSADKIAEIKATMKKEATDQIDTHLKDRIEQYAEGPGISASAKQMAKALKESEMTSSKSIEDALERDTTEHEGADGKKTYDLTGPLRKVAGMIGMRVDGLNYKELETLRGKISDLPFTKQAVDQAKRAEAEAGNKGKTSDELLSGIDGKMGSIIEGFLSIARAVDGLKLDT